MSLIKFERIKLNAHDMTKKMINNSRIFLLPKYIVLASIEKYAVIYLSWDLKKSGISPNTLPRLDGVIFPI